MAASGSANNALIGALRVEATLDAGKFVDGAAKIRKESKQTEATVKSSFTGMGAAIKSGIAGFIGTLTVGYFTSLINASLKYAGSLAEVGQQLGVTAQDLQRFRFMAGQVGVSQEQLETGLSKLTITLGKVAAGAQEPTKALKAIGLSAKDVANIDTGEAFRKIADGLSKVTDRSQRAAVEVALFGKTGSMLDNMLSGGSAQINNLAAAAEKLGIVLSDEQIRKADDTADKLEALKTVLSAQIAGVVADNADAIYRLADSLSHLVAQIPNAIRGLKGFYAQFLDFSANVTEKVDQAIENPLNRFNPLVMGMRGGQMHANRLANIQADRAAAAGIRSDILGGQLRGLPLLPPELQRSRRSTGNISQFLAPSGGSRKAPKGPEDQSAETLAQFQHQQMQADADILRAKQQMATSSVERAKIELQLIELDRQMQAAELDEQVNRAKKDAADGRIKKDALAEVELSAAKLKEKNDEVARLKAQAVVDERTRQVEEDTFAASEQQREFAIDNLKFADQMATTQADHRRIQLQILDAEIEQKRLELEHQKQLAIRNGATAEEIQTIQDKIDHLGIERAQGAAGIIRNTQNPIEQWAASVPKSAAEINEALQGIAAHGLEDLSDALTGVITGTESLKEAFHRLALSVLQDLIQMTIKMLIFRALSSVIGSVGGSVGSASLSAPMSVSGLDPGSLFVPTSFATGGGFDIRGRSGTDKNLLSLNGIPIANVSYGERVNISNDNDGAMMPPVSLTMHNDFRGANPSAVAAIKAHLDQLQANLPTIVLSTMSDARDRFLWRTK